MAQTLDDLLRFIANPPPGDLSLTADSRQVQVSVVNRIAMATTGSVLNLITLYPEDFATGGYVPGSGGDDTACMQATIDHAIANAGSSANVAIRLPPVLNFNSPPRHDRQGNSILAMPQSTDPVLNLKLLCAPGGTTVFCGATGLSYSASYGCPSIIGGPTNEQVGPASATYSTCTLEIDGRLTLFANSDRTVCGLNVERMGGRADRLVVAGSIATAPPNTWTFGARLPDGHGGGFHIRDYEAYGGFYAALVCPNPHQVIHRFVGSYAVVSLGLTGSAQYAASDQHASSISYLNTQASNYHIAGWSPTGGVIGLPAANRWFGSISMWDIENDSPGWYTTTAHIYDPNNAIFAFMILSVAAPSMSFPTITGGGNIQIFYIASGGFNNFGSWGMTVQDGAGIKSAGHLVIASGAAADRINFQDHTSTDYCVMDSTGVAIDRVGAGLKVKEGSNAKQGTATLAAGTVVVANTSVTASSRIVLTAQDNNTTGALRVSARTAGTSFTITSSNAGDTGVVAYQIFEPA
jgi:hypothetical protein